MSEPTLYKWKAEYNPSNEFTELQKISGLEQRIKRLEIENNILYSHIRKRLKQINVVPLVEKVCVETQYNISILCEVLHIPRSNYYKRNIGNQNQHKQADDILFETILPIIVESGYTDGGTRIKIYLNNETTYTTPSRQRISRIMKEHGIVVVNDPRKSRIAYTPIVGDEVCQNLLQSITV